MSKKEVAEFAERIADLFIRHEEVDRIWDRFDSMRVHLKAGKQNEDPRHLLLTGLSGVGKTQIGKRYMKRNPPYEYKIDDKNILVMPVLHVKLPYPFTQVDFYKRILKSLRAPIIRSDARVNYLKEQALILLRAQKTEMIIFDEMNFIIRSKRFDNQEAMEMFKDLTNEGQVCLVCMGTPQIEVLRTMEDEYIRRFGRETVSRFEILDDKFRLLLRKIEEAIQPPVPLFLDSEETAAFLHECCQGRIGYLHSIIIEAYRLLGVFEPDFSDLSKAHLTVSTLAKASYNLYRDSDHLATPAGI
ncbi:TniB family NTP-binding protein [Paenibacillus sp. FSL M7-1046]|uniref:TniB family NTP-binding protein n=1 Tax=Paenibacillus sp. FSL M7-1046 TaxID=2975315 RepID=UPI0030FB1386